MTHDLPFKSPQSQRFSETTHKEAIEQARQSHERVRDGAVAIFHAWMQEEELRRLQEEKDHEEERIRREETLAAERIRLLELRSKKAEIPPETEQAKPTPPPPPSAKPELVKVTPARAPEPVPAPSRSNLKHYSLPPLLETAKPTTLQPPPTATASVNPITSLQSLYQGKDRYAQVHQNLKALRKNVEFLKSVNPALKTRLGDMRRDVRKSVGQLTSGGGGVNKGPQLKIVSVLREAMQNQAQSPLVDPSGFALTPREPVAGCPDLLPSLFLYVMNIFTKAVFSQFVTEASAKPETADPVGIIAAATLSEPEFYWRGKSFIDMLLAKFKVFCPVLFGSRGEEDTDQGRQRLGWRKEGGRWVPEQAHMDRMTGLGAGFASISLRNFSRSNKQNPFPPRHYWEAMARIVSTPADQISDTQCIVLFSMIEHYEDRFIDAYGSAAVAALRMALIDFPGRVPKKSAASKALEVKASVLERDTGLRLA